MAKFLVGKKGVGARGSRKFSTVKEFIYLQGGGERGCFLVRVAFGS